MKATAARLTLVMACLAAGAGAWAVFFKPPPAKVPAQAVANDRLPRLWPDYVDCVIPPNIAPLNFLVQEPGSQYRVRVYGDSGSDFVVASRKPSVDIPVDKWRQLLRANLGGQISFDVYVRDEGGQWQRYRPVNNTVAPEPIDPYLVYRLLGPLHIAYRHMGILQRNIENFDESPILRGECVPEEAACVNCHTFVANDPGTMIIHQRSEPFGHAMLLATADGVTKICTGAQVGSGPAAYASWHPTGTMVAFSVNSVALHHTAGGDTRFVFDHNSDLGVYVVDTNGVGHPKAIADPDYLETFPCWSPDGGYLYFARTAKTWTDEMAKQRKLPRHYDRVRYDLMRISYDADAARWGSVETVLTGQEVGGSIIEPRVSPDGKFVLFTVAPHGSFPVYMDDSDLHILELSTGQHWRLTANSDLTESWHSWSSNGRWIVFTSKRHYGRPFARPYLCYIDADGRSSKPFVLPQKDPRYYDTLLCTYNAPELVTGRVEFTEEQLKAAIIATSGGQDATAITGASPQATETARPEPD